MYIMYVLDVYETSTHMPKHTLKHSITLGLHVSNIDGSSDHTSLAWSKCVLHDSDVQTDPPITHPWPHDPHPLLINHWIFSLIGCHEQQKQYQFLWPCIMPSPWGKGHWSPSQYYLILIWDQYSLSPKLVYELFMICVINKCAHQVLIWRLFTTFKTRLQANGLNIRIWSEHVVFIKGFRIRWRALQWIREWDGGSADTPPHFQIMLLITHSVRDPI